MGGMGGMEQVMLVAMPEAGHIASMVELGKRIIQQNPNLRVTILAPTVPFSPVSTTTPPAGIDKYSPNLTFQALPQLHSPELQNLSGIAYYPVLSKLLKPILLDLLTTQLIPVKALVFDLIFIGSMIQVATQTSIPPYLYYTSNASMLGLLLRLPSFDLQPHDEALPLPGFETPVPLSVLPSFILSKGVGEGPLSQGYNLMLNSANHIFHLKGIIINTLPELEPGVNDLFSDLDKDDKRPLLYPVGPILDVDGLALSRPNDGWSHFDNNIVNWLHEQADASVIFLCFGSRGAFGPAQVRQIAFGLELSGHKFLWALRKPPGGPHEGPTNYLDFSEVLPEGFLERTTGKQGFVCGWAPQGRILGHPSIGGFVSHCGWNSVLESLWYGVPILAWPMYAEQKLNAYGLVESLGLAHVVKGNYLEGRDLMENYTDKGDLVTKEEVEEGINRIMEVDCPVRKKVKDVSNKMRKAVTPPDGSSLFCLQQFIQDISLPNPL